MIKKVSIIVVLSILALYTVISFNMEWINLNTTMFGKIDSLSMILSKKDISKLDEYFLSSTVFTYKNNKIDYSQAKKNLANSIDSNEVMFPPNSIQAIKILDDSSPIKKISVVAYPRTKKTAYEIYFVAKLKKIGIFKWDIIEMQSEDDIFGHIFVDHNIELK